MQPFTGIRVLDLTHVLAGPFATYQLAVLGADVIKIEPPAAPDMVRQEGPIPEYNDSGMGTHYLAQNSNKRAITLNLKSEAGRDILRRLVTTADVLVQNYRSDALSSLGLGYEALAVLNDQLIYCSITGFGATGPYGKRTAYDNVIQAMSGIMMATGTEEISPLKVGAPVIDYGTGAQAAFAIASALFQRTRTGRGQFIDVAMLDAALMLMTMHVADFLMGGVAPKPRGNVDVNNAGYSCYATRDGLLMLGAYTGRQQDRLWRLLGRDDIAEAIATAGYQELREHRQKHAELLAEILLTRSAADWETALAAAQVPAARVRGLAEMLGDRQLEHRGVLHRRPPAPNLPAGLAVPVAAFTYATDGPAVDRAPPSVGQHTAEVLEELGLSQEDQRRLKSAGVI